MKETPKEPRSPVVAVVTATTGHRYLARAIWSVRAQTYSSITHCVVIDGPEYSARVEAGLREAGEGPEPLSVLQLPRRTGHSGWCSHRIYAAVPFLLDTEYICYLDQDNWFEPDHVASLLDLTASHGQGCGYALRNICTPDGEFVCKDDCQSLGTLHDCYDRPRTRHIDTNCWLLSRDLACAVAPYWNTALVGDRVLAREIMTRKPEIPCTKRYTVNYSTASRAESATAEYFLRGNAMMARRYPHGLAWHR
jgi:hypothetical protein